MRILGLIPARGGSKGIPDKNIKALLGKPLLQYSAEVALQAEVLDRVVLSTDSQRIADVGLDCGLDVPFLRPPELAEDNTPTLEVVQHAIHWLEGQGEHFDAVCLLQPTSPFRSSEDINHCVALMAQENATAVISVVPVPAEYNPHWVYFQDTGGQLRLSTGEENPISRRQALPPAYHRNGAIYLTRRDIIINEDTLYGSRVYGYTMDPARAINLDTPEDWEDAIRFLASNSQS